uniref:PDZ domain-containing protein n=1 Tax=Parastrongyloides trichosuri TaxID=131310 RepID=A0A0N4ZBC0_PARTI
MINIVEEVRNALKSDIPNYMNTEYHIKRWLKANKNNVDETVKKFRKYLEVRKCYKCDDDSYFDNFYNNSEIINFRKIFSQSIAEVNWYNSKDNALIFVESAVNDTGSVTKAIRVNDYVKIFFTCCEYFQRILLKHEAISGKESSGICIFDMSNFSLMNYANPVSAINKMYETRIDIWLNYYSELLKKVIIVNGPRIMSLSWKVLSILLPSDVHDRFMFATSLPHDLEKTLSLDCIPISFGGKKEIENCLPNCCNVVDKLMSKDFKKNGEIWLKEKITPLKPKNISLSPGETFKEFFNVKENQKLIYEFYCNRDYTLKITLNKDILLNPDIKLSTPVLIIPPVVTSKPVIVHNSVNSTTFENKKHYKTQKSLAESAYSSLESPLGRSTNLVTDNQNNLDDEISLIQRCVVVYADCNGYGITVSKSYPVIVENIDNNGAAYKAGVKKGDRIFKVNGIQVTPTNCTKVLNMIYENCNVVLTLHGKPFDNSQLLIENNQKNIEKQKIEELKKEKITTINQMLQDEKTNVEKLKASSPNNKTPLKRALKRIEVLQSQLKKLDNHYVDSQIDDYETIADDSSFITSQEHSLKHSHFYEPYKTNMNNVKGGDGFSISKESDNFSMPSSLNLSTHGPFSNLPELKSRPAHLAIFMNYLLQFADPSCLLFCLITDVYQTAPVTYKELRKWAYEIFSTFLIPNAPLVMPSIDQTIIQNFDKVLARPSCNSEDYLEELHIVFIPSKRKALEHVNLDLIAFRHKQQLGLGDIFDPKILEQLEKNGSGMEDRIAEQMLLKTLESQFNIINGDLEKAKSKNVAIICALATVIKNYFGMRPNSAHFEKLLEKCPTFVTKDKSGGVFKMKSINPKRIVNIKGHQFILQPVNTTIFCYQCREAVWGVNPQAYFCQNCDVTIHKICSPNLIDHCYPATQQKKNQQGKKKATSSLLTSSKTTNTSDLTHTSSSNTHNNCTDFGISMKNVISLHDINNTRYQPISTSSSAPSNNTSSVGGFTTTGMIQPNVMERTAAYVKATAAYSAAGISKGPTGSVVVDETIYNKSTFSDSDIISTGSTWITGSDFKGKSVSRSQSLHCNKSFETKSRVNNNKGDGQVLPRVNELSQMDITENDSSPNEKYLNNLSNGDETDVFADSGENDSDLEVNIEIPSLENILSTETIRHLKPKERKRQEVLNEFFHTEKTHLRNLKVLYKVFYCPLLTKKWCSSYEIEILFGQLEELLDIHREIIKKIQARIDIWRLKPDYNGLYGDISDLVLSIFQGPDGERLKLTAAEYCKNQQHALNYLRKKQGKGKEDPLAKFLMTAENNSLCRKLQLKDMLPMEMQRLVKYPLLLEGVAKYTPDPSQEYDGLLKAISAAKKIVSYVNTAKETSENERKLMDINNRIDMSYKSSSNEIIKSFDITKHKLIHDGSLQWKISKNKIIDMHVVLLHGYLICLTKGSDGNKLYLKSHEPSKDVRLHPIMFLNSLMIREKANDKRAFFALYKTNDSQQMFDVVAPTVSELKTWFRFLGEQIEIIQKDNLNDPTLRLADLNNDIKSRLMLSNSDDLNGADSDKVHVVTHPRLVDANEIMIQQPTVFEHAEPILTPEEKLKRNDRIIVAALSEKHQILCSLINSITKEQLIQLSEHLAGLSVTDLKQKDSKELALSAIVHGNRLLDSINRGMSVRRSNDNESTYQIDDYEKHLPSVPCYKLTAIAAPLMNHLKALLQTIQDQQNEIIELKKQLNTTIGHLVMKDLPLDDNPPAVPNSLPPDDI